MTLHVNDIYEQTFINKINHLFGKDIITDEMVANGYVEPRVPLAKALGELVHYEGLSKQPN